MTITWRFGPDPIKLYKSQLPKLSKCLVWNLKNNQASVCLEKCFYNLVHILYIVSYSHQHVFSWRVQLGREGFDLVGPAFGLEFRWVGSNPHGIFPSDIGWIGPSKLKRHANPLQWCR